MPRYVAVVFLIAVVGLAWSFVAGFLGYFMNSEFIFNLNYGGMIVAGACIVFNFLALVITIIKDISNERRN